MTDRKLIIRASLLYEFKLGASASSASRKLCTAFGEGAVSATTTRCKNDPCQDSRTKLGDYAPSTVFTRPLSNRFLLVFELR